MRKNTTFVSKKKFFAMVDNTSSESDPQEENRMNTDIKFDQSESEKK